MRAFLDIPPRTFQTGIFNAIGTIFWPSALYFVLRIFLHENRQRELLAYFGASAMVKSDTKPFNENEKVRVNSPPCWR